MWTNRSASTRVASDGQLAGIIAMADKPSRPQPRNERAALERLGGAGFWKKPDEKDEQIFQFVNGEDVPLGHVVTARTYIKRAVWIVRWVGGGERTRAGRMREHAP